MRNFRRSFCLALFAATLALGMQGCAVLDAAVTPIFMMSIEKEIAVGEQFKEEIEKDLVFVEDEEIVNYVRKVGATVVAHAKKQAEVPVTFSVVVNEEINAFAIPGGHIYVHTGLIDSSEDEAELASVLAHELGHVVYRHGAKHVSRATGYQVGAAVVEAVVLGRNSGISTEVVRDLIGKGVLQNYSRRDELEADSIAIPTLYAAGYDPGGMITFFETLNERYGEQSGAATFFASHPPTSDRIERVRESIDMLPPKEGLLRPIGDLRRIQAKLQDLGYSAR